MTADQFNEKYNDYLDHGHYGLALDNSEAIAYLDNEFQEFIKDPDFSYSQIKSKCNSFRFYNTGLTEKQTREVEQKLKQIYDGE